MSDNTMQLELDTAFQQGYDRGQADAYKDAFHRVCDLFDKYRKVEELNDLYARAKAGVKNE